MRKTTGFLSAAILIAAAGCASQRPAVKITSVHVDRAAIVLARQGKEKNESVMEKIAEAIVPVAEVATMAVEPLAGLAVIGGHVAIALTEKGGDVGGRRFATEVYHGNLHRMMLEFQTEGTLKSVTVEMADEEEIDDSVSE